MKTDATQDRQNNRMHQHYSDFQDGDGATTEFFLSRTVSSLDELHVYIDGQLKRPDNSGTAHDYKVRGLTPGYDGDKNAVKFASAPAAGHAVGFHFAST